MGRGAAAVESAQVENAPKERPGEWQVGDEEGS